MSSTFDRPRSPSVPADSHQQHPHSAGHVGPGNKRTTIPASISNFDGRVVCLCSRSSASQPSPSTDVTPSCSAADLDRTVPGTHDNPSTSVYTSTYRHSSRLCAWVACRVADDDHRVRPSCELSVQAAHALTRVKEIVRNRTVHKGLDNSHRRTLHRMARFVSQQGWADPGLHLDRNRGHLCLVRLDDRSPRRQGERASAAQQVLAVRDKDVRIQQALMDPC